MIYTYRRSLSQRRLTYHMRWMSNHWLKLTAIYSR